MESIFGRLTRIFIRYSVKIISLLLAVSILAFILVDASPIDPVQQYILSLGAAVSPEQQAQIAAYWGADTPPLERYIS